MVETLKSPEHALAGNEKMSSSVSQTLGGRRGKGRKISPVKSPLIGRDYGR